MGKFESQKTDYLDIDKLYEQYKPLMNSIFKKFTKYTNVFHDSSDYEGYPLGVGSGWSDSEREYYWQHPEEIIGKTISISYQNKSENLDGGKSLRFPVKKIIRFDK